MERRRGRRDRETFESEFAGWMSWRSLRGLIVDRSHQFARASAGEAIEAPYRLGPSRPTGPEHGQRRSPAEHPRCEELVGPSCYDMSIGGLAGSSAAPSRSATRVELTAEEREQYQRLSGPSSEYRGRSMRAHQWWMGGHDCEQCRATKTEGQRAIRILATRSGTRPLFPARKKRRPRGQPRLKGTAPTRRSSRRQADEARPISCKNS